MTQDERLAKRDALRAEIVKLEESIRLLLEQEELLLKDCAHTYAGGQSALVGGRTKILRPLRPRRGGQGRQALGLTRSFARLPSPATGG